MDLEQLAEWAFAPSLAAVAAGRIPGAAFGVVAGHGRAVRVAGSAQLVPERREMSRDTWFDLASLTKVVFTTPAILSLVERGHIALDDALVSVIPDLRQYDMAAPERRLTFRQCLGHQTHLPAVEPIYTYGHDPDTLRAFVLQRDWKPGPPVYSDIGFILLGIALERVCGRRIRDMAVPPGLTFAPDPALAAATEACSWRGRVVVGEVHDENAYALQSAGHAGLFGTVDGVLDYARDLLDAPDRGVAQVMRTPVAGHRAHGWEIAHVGWSGGNSCSPGTIGHTGFTGTGLWIDFERGVGWTLLTNRVHPTRHADTGIATLRAETGRMVTEAF